MGKFISLRQDYSFKEVFRNEKVRRHFISDVLGIPLEQIRTVRLHNTFLWTQYWRQKQGILDVLLVLNDDRKINIELQIRMQADWDKRSLFYLAKVFVADLLRGEDYRKLNKCIGISILNFSLDNAPEYHKVYHLRDSRGRMFSDIIELHIVELNKKLSGMDQTDEWIKLFRVDTSEELDMLVNQTKNQGVLEAIEEVRVMNLSKRLRAIHEFHLREQRDKEALEDQIRMDALSRGLEEGRTEGLQQGIQQGIQQGLQQGKVETLIMLVKQDLLSVADAAQNAGMSEEEFVKEMEKDKA